MKYLLCLALVGLGLGMIPLARGADEKPQGARNYEINPHKLMALLHQADLIAIGEMKSVKKDSSDERGFEVTKISGEILISEPLFLHEDKAGQLDRIPFEYHWQAVSYFSSSHRWVGFMEPPTLEEFIDAKVLIFAQKQEGRWDVLSCEKLHLWDENSLAHLRKLAAQTPPPTKISAEDLDREPLYYTIQLTTLMRSRETAWATKLTLLDATLASKTASTKSYGIFLACGLLATPGHEADQPKLLTYVLEDIQSTNLDREDKLGRICELLQNNAFSADAQKQITARLDGLQLTENSERKILKKILRLASANPPPLEPYVPDPQLLREINSPAPVAPEPEIIYTR